jgi:hypothetical protein
MRASPVLNNIKNLTLPACVDCIYFKKGDQLINSTIKQAPECTKFGTKDLVSGVIKYESARHCRDMKVLCGMNALYFVKKDDLATQAKMYTENIH